MNRKQFISTVSGAAVSAVVGSSALAGTYSSTVSANAAPAHKVRRGVSLYSYQQAMMLNRMTLEEGIRELSDIGAYGVEAMGQVVIKGYPNPTDQWIGEWWDMLDKYNVVPVAYTNFHDKYLQKKAPMTVAENLEYQTREFRLGKRLGFTKFRMLIGTPIPLLEAAIPVAEKMGIWMGLELHAPVTLKSKIILKVLELAEKHPETIGLYPDMGIFQKYPRPYAREQQVKAGTLTSETALFIEDSYRKGVEKEIVASKVKGMKPKPGDTAYVETVYRSGATYQNPQDIIPLLKYCKNIHGKFYEMTGGSEFTDTTITYEPVLKVLMENGYDGYICTEYEGQRSMEIADVDEVDQVRRQHVMMKRVLGV